MVDILPPRNTLGASAILGIITDNHLTTDQFNTLGSAFYIGVFYSLAITSRANGFFVAQASLSSSSPRTGRYSIYQSANGSRSIFSSGVSSSVYIHCVIASDHYVRDK